jgi:Mce-associated membrane protein
MSPVRRVEPTDPVLLRMPEQAPPRRALLAVGAGAATVIAAALTLTGVVFAQHQSAHRGQLRDADVLSFVASFVTLYTSPDPFNANQYAEQVLAQGTGEFAKLFGQKMNGIVIQVAQAERGFGAVQDIGIERWNSDGSADVIAVSMMTTKLPDGKTFESPTRWVVTAAKEGDRWKVSNLKQVI